MSNIYKNSLPTQRYHLGSFMLQMKQLYFTDETVLFQQYKIKTCQLYLFFLSVYFIEIYRTHQAAPTTDREMDMPVPISPHIYGEVDIRNLTSQIKNYT